jgi:hypothetical protein
MILRFGNRAADTRGGLCRSRRAQGPSAAAAAARKICGTRGGGGVCVARTHLQCKALKNLQGVSHLDAPFALVEDGIVHDVECVRAAQATQMADPRARGRRCHGQTAGGGRYARLRDLSNTIV